MSIETVLELVDGYFLRLYNYYVSISKSTKSKYYTSLLYRSRLSSKVTHSGFKGHNGAGVGGRGVEIWLKDLQAENIGDQIQHYPSMTN